MQLYDLTAGRALVPLAGAKATDPGAGQFGLGGGELLGGAQECVRDR